MKAKIPAAVPASTVEVVVVTESIVDVSTIPPFVVNNYYIYSSKFLRISVNFFVKKCYSLWVKKYDIAIIGAGPAGIMCAINAAKKGASVILIEKNEKIGRKILATGNGRCNITNRNITKERYHNEDIGFVEKVLSQFDQGKTIEYFESIGVFLKEEDRGRMFPRTNQASTVVEALAHELKDAGVEILTSAEVKDIKKQDNWEVTISDGQKLSSSKLVLTTGGKAAHQFGSSGDGLFFAQKLGHKITSIYAALCPIETKESWVSDLQGIKVEAIITSVAEGKTVHTTKGDAIFTHFGISGPAAMAQSRKIAPELEKGEVKIFVDLYPELSEQELDQKLEILFRENSKKTVKNNLSGILTSGLVPVILRTAKVDPDKKSAEISKQIRKSIVEKIKNLELTVKKIRPLKEAQVTSGGIRLDEVNPETLESKIVPGLYFAGEILDVDGDSGGFNLQWAWSSGYLSGKNV
jgi:predicted Rossmann fold flavoprotein